MFCISVRMYVFQVEPPTDDEATTSARSTSDVSSSAYSTEVTTSTDPSDRTTTSPCKANITIDHPANEMKKRLLVTLHVASLNFQRNGV